MSGPRKHAPGSATLALRSEQSEPGANGAAPRANGAPGSNRRRSASPPPSRPRLLAAAKALLEASGYEAVTMSAICDQAGLSRPTFYAHFADKRALIAAALDPDLAEVEARLRAAAADERPWAEPMLGALDQALADLHRSPGTSRARIVEAMTALVATSGYETVTVRALCDEAGPSPQTFYAHFADRRECFAAAHAELVAQIDRHLAEAAPTGEHQPDGPEARAHAVAALRALTALLAAEPATARIVVCEAGVLAGAPAPKDEDAAPGSLGELIDRHVLAGLGAPSHAARRMAVGGVLTLLADVLAAHGAESLPGFLPDLAFAALCPLLGPEPALREMERAAAGTAASAAAPATSAEAIAPPQPQEAVA